MIEGPFRDDDRGRDSIDRIRNELHGAPENLLRHLCEELEQAGLELPELLRRGAAAVPAERLLEHAGKQQVRVFEELGSTATRESLKAIRER